MEGQITCPRCKNPDCHDSESFCFNCGASLMNFCTNEYCDINNGGKEELPASACFCSVCGSKTHFMEEGYISPITFE